MMDSALLACFGSLLPVSATSIRTCCFHGGNGLQFAGETGTRAGTRRRSRSWSSNSLLRFCSLPRAPELNSNEISNEREEREDGGEFQVVAAVRTDYNEIVIVDTVESRLLLLDSTHNVHSIMSKSGEKWTGSYWDEFVSLPAIVPEGPIAIYGLGGGTEAHMMLEIWPSLQLEGWEIDGILVDKAREYLGLSDLEKHNKAGGKLQVHIGDAFSNIENISEYFAGIIIDLFSEGRVPARLQEIETWLELDKRLMPGGRIMVNCGGISEATNDGKFQCTSEDEIWTLNSTIKALVSAFPGQVSWKRLPKSRGENYLAMTGPSPDLALWSTSVPDHLIESVKEWRSCRSLV